MLQANIKTDHRSQITERETWIDIEREREREREREKHRERKTHRENWRDEREKQRERESEVSGSNGQWNKIERARE